MRYERNDILLVVSTSYAGIIRIRSRVIRLRFAVISAGNGSQRPCVRLFCGQVAFYDAKKDLSSLFTARYPLGGWS